MELPGTIIHKQILNSLLELFKQDKNVRAFIIFGSLVRGNWDKYSDLDLDIVAKEMKADVIHYFEEFTNEFVFIFNSL